jgi:WD40 repeat protein
VAADEGAGDRRLSAPSEPEDPRYWAFLSYSHRDKAWGDWLHKALETYKVPSRLVGQETAGDPVPVRAYPVFRDREELPSSADLGAEIDRALRAARTLIVLCSPNSARSQWVEQEIRRFKALGREHRVFCLIVDGEPGASEIPGREDEECFPAAVRYRVDEAGELTDERTEPIAADAREGKDGKQDALLKLLAGVLQVRFDELKQRDQARRIRQLRMVAGVSLALAAVFVVLSVGFYRARNEAVAARNAEQVAREEAESARDAEAEARLEAQARLRDVYRQRGLEAYLGGEDAASLFYLEQARGLAGGADHAGYFRAAAWERVRRLVRDFSGNEERVAHLAFATDGARLLAQGVSGAARGWNLETGARALTTPGWTDASGFEATTLAGAAGRVVERHRVARADDPDYVDRALRVLDADGVPQGKGVAWSREWSDSGKVAVSAGGERLLTILEGLSGDDPVYRLWDPATGAGVPLPEVEGLASNFRWDFSPDGSYLVQRGYTGGGPFPVVVRDGGDGRVLARFEYTGRPDVLAMAEDVVAIGTTGGRVETRELPGGALRWEDEAVHRATLAGVALSADGATLLSGDILGEVVLWDVATGKPRRRLTRPGEDGVVTALTLSADGTLAAYAQGKALLAFDAEVGELLSREAWHEADITALAIDPLRRRVATATERGAVRVWELESGSPARIIAGPRPPDGVAPAPLVRDRAGKLGAMCGFGWVRLYRLDDAGAAVEELAFHKLGDSSGCLAAAPDAGPAALVVSGGSGHLVAFGADGAPFEVTPGAAFQVPSFSASPWDLGLSADGTGGGLLSADGSLVTFGLAAGQVTDLRLRAGVLPDSTPPGRILGVDGDIVLLAQGGQLLVHRVAAGATDPHPRGPLVGGTLITVGDEQRVATLDPTGTLEVCTLTGELRAQRPLPRPPPPVVNLRGPEVRVNERLLALPGAGLVAAVLDECVYLVGADDGTLRWRSPPLAPIGIVELAGAEEEGRVLRVAVLPYEGARPSKILRLRLPDPTAMDSEQVAAKLRDVLGMRLEGGRLVRRHPPAGAKRD